MVPGPGFGSDAVAAAFAESGACCCASHCVFLVLISFSPKEGHTGGVLLCVGGLGGFWNAGSVTPGHVPWVDTRREWASVPLPAPPPTSDHRLPPGSGDQPPLVPLPSREPPLANRKCQAFLLFRTGARAPSPGNTQAFPGEMQAPAWSGPGAFRCWCVHLQGTGGHRPTVKQTQGGRGTWPRATATPKGAAGAPPPSEGHPGASWGTRTPLGRRRVSHELVPDCVSSKLGCSTGRPPASSGKQAHSLPVVGEGPRHPRGAAARSAPPAPTLSEQFLVFSCSKCKVG